MLPAYPDPFYDACGVFLCDQVRRRFAAAGEPGAAWPISTFPGMSSRPLGGASSLLAQSIDYIIYPTGPHSVKLSIGTNKDEAAILHFGGTIYPKTAKALFVPLTPRARQMGPKPKGERAVKSVTKKGAEVYKPGLVYGVDFLLLGSVTIKARPFLIMPPESSEAFKRNCVHELRARLRH